jgi:hypothetical protein
MNRIDGRSHQGTSRVTNYVDKHITLRIGIRTDQHSVIKSRNFHILNQIIGRIQIDRGGAISSRISKQASQSTNSVGTRQAVEIDTHRRGLT